MNEIPKKKRRCSKCGHAGHNRASCGRWVYIIGHTKHPELCPLCQDEKSSEADPATESVDPATEREDPATQNTNTL